jgi:hypothetical protein
MQLGPAKLSRDERHRTLDYKQLQSVKRTPAVGQKPSKQSSKRMHFVIREILYHVQ